MKGLLVLAVLLFAAPVFAGNYILVIDDRSDDISLGEKYEITLPDGKKAAVTLEQKDILEFRTKNFSFSHAKEFIPSRADLGNNTWQTMMTTPIGTLVLVQEYGNINPDMLAGMVLESIIGEERDAGYRIRTQSSRKILPDGTELKGKNSVSSLDETEYIREVYTFSGKNSGLLILTQIERESLKDEQTALDLFWDSLKITVE